jgi:hypothetical protein
MLRKDRPIGIRRNSVIEKVQPQCHFTSQKASEQTHLLTSLPQADTTWWRKITHASSFSTKNNFHGFRGHVPSNAPLNLHFFERLPNRNPTIFQQIRSLLHGPTASASDPPPQPARRTIRSTASDQAGYTKFHREMSQELSRLAPEMPPNSAGG